MLLHLSELTVSVSAEQMVADLVPPDLFAQVSFDSYLTDPQHPSQSEARDAVRAFVTEMVTASNGRSMFRRRGSRSHSTRPGLYLDGGFGVGKTHLLAAAFHAAPGPKAFGTFMEYTAIVGALGFRQAAEQLGDYRLICIDEFELDDPGDTLMMTRLLGLLVAGGARIIATSNTPPNALGEGRFAAADFFREIQTLADVFTAFRIEGADYRARDLTGAAPVFSEAGLGAAVDRLDGRGAAIAVDSFGELAGHLQQVHPVRYAALLRDVDVVAWAGVTSLGNQNEALRLVALIDRLYDAQIPVIASGVPVTAMFPEDMLEGGYRKKYLRAISRLGALAELGRDF